MYDGASRTSGKASIHTLHPLDTYEQQTAVRVNAGAYSFMSFNIKTNAATQGLGFFCSLPLNPGKTHMECVPIPK